MILPKYSIKPNFGHHILNTVLSFIAIISSAYYIHSNTQNKTASNIALIAVIVFLSVISLFALWELAQITARKPRMDFYEDKLVFDGLLKHQKIEYANIQRILFRVKTRQITFLHIIYKESHMQNLKTFSTDIAYLKSTTKELVEIFQELVGIVPENGNT